MTKITTEQFINKAKLFHGDKFDYSKLNYINDKNKIEIICVKHGSFITLPSSHMRSDNGGCIKCAGNFQYTNDDFIKKANLFHNYKYDYSLVSYISNNTDVTIICPIHGKFSQIPTNHYKYGCIKCSGKEMKSKEDFIIESNIVHCNKFDYSLVDYNGMFSKVTILCDQHGEFNQLPTNHLHGKRGCPKCSKRISKNETLWLDYIGIPNDKKHRNVYLKINEHKFFVDGYSEETNTIYEYNGDYWHGNLELYNPKDIHPKIGISFKELYDKTESKRKIFQSAGYNVISVWESEFLSSQKDKTSIIIYDNKYAQLKTTDIKNFNKLRNFLSFKTAGVEYTAAYKNGWNGITYLLDNKGYFLSGLMTKVIDFLNSNNILFTLIDKRHPDLIENKIDLTNKLDSLNMIPRNYQKKIVDTVLQHKKGIVRACTGSGKTLCTAMITANINKKTIIYVIGLDLLNQFHELFSSIFDEPIGFIGNGVCNIQRINIASIWTISSALKIKTKILDDDECGEGKELEPNQNQAINILDMLKNTKVHIFDESHVITTDTIKSIFNKIDPEYIYGFSGTPFRDDGSDLLINSILGEQIVNVPASELISDGYLAQPIIKFIKVPKTFISSGTSNYQTVYKEYVTENEIRNSLIIKNTLELLQKNYQVLVLFKHLQHGKNLRELFDLQNIKYEYLSGTDQLDKRIEVKSNLLSHKSNLVLASSIFDIGVDISSLSALVLAGGGKSSIRTLQRVGRVIRKYSNKKYAAIVDFYDDVKFLKTHSKKRYNIYNSENGFKLIIPKNITDLK
ncbi:SSL2 DNA or RNA helicases of superfamily II [uncultured Caudovirales phage]|uniref:SSL2 DNA or RNA helicases of superfamily II n=1 Tax=uncultured Caudovirales phage TaxID=2100421 RepID=A0A6J5RQG2_9CAUD|nr:SSL2 DNA or RNA helicases of superfamily II [uncultured Caudovirales phage]